MAEIIYFGTDGCSGHSPIGIDKTLTHAEYKMWGECDNETWINNIRKNPGRHLIKHHGEVYTNYGVPFIKGCDYRVDYNPFIGIMIYAPFGYVNISKWQLDNYFI